MENKQKEEKLTAMEQLIHWIDSDCTPMDCVMKAKELLKVEKEQIKDAWKDPMWHRVIQKNVEEILEYSAEEYYNETYGKGN